jgi:hypothetical protein
MGFGDFKNTAPEIPKEPPKRWWSAIGGWFVMGALFGVGVFAWTARRDLGSMVKDPRALAAAKDLKQAAKDFAEAYVPAAKKYEGEAAPEQPSADQLAAPVDPSHARSQVGQKGTTGRSLGVRRRANEKDMQSAADAVEYRQDMRMEVLQDDFSVPFWDTDLGRGIKYSAYFSLFFGAVGWLLFMTQSKHRRTF